MEDVTKFYEIDVSLEVFDVSLPDGKHVQLSNDAEGYQKLGHCQIARVIQLDETARMSLDNFMQIHQITPMSLLGIDINNRYELSAALISQLLTVPFLE